VESWCSQRGTWRSLWRGIFFLWAPHHITRCVARGEGCDDLRRPCVRERERNVKRRREILALPLITLIRECEHQHLLRLFFLVLCLLLRPTWWWRLRLRVRAKHDLVLPHLDPCVYAYVRALILVRSLLRSTTSLWGAVCVLLLDDKVRINTNHMCRKLDLQPWTTN
jgi:hypothetical protein